MLMLWGRCRPVSPEGRGGELRGRGYEAQTKIWGFGVPSFSQDSHALLLRICLLKTGGINSLEQFKRCLVEIKLAPSPPAPRGHWHPGTRSSFLLFLRVSGTD